MHRPSRVLGAIVGLLWSQALLAVDDTELLKSRLDGLTSVAGHFEQVTINAENRVVQENSGRLWVRSPSSFRIETRTPFMQVLVSDGTSFWTYEEDLAQVMIQPLEDDIAQVPILLLGGRASAIVDAYEVSRYEDEAGEKFVLAPRAPGALFESMTIGFEADRPTLISIRDSLGQRTRIDVVDATINEPIDDERFSLEIPEGVDVIDDRSSS